jgi:hypothetical protein
MGLLDIKEDPNYQNANAATKQAIFDEYSKDDPDYQNANPATRDAIRQEFGVGSAVADTTEPMLGTPQAVTVGTAVAQELAPAVGGVAKDTAQTAYNVGKAVVGYPVDVVKNAVTWTPRSIFEVVTNPLTTAKQYIGNSPLMQSNASLKSVAKDALQYAKNVGSALPSARNIGSAIVQGAVAPESLFAAPYQMAAYEQEKIRQNPNAPEYATTPYAQMYRGEYATQGQAGAANRRNAIASQQYGGLTQAEQDILEQDRINREIRRKAAERVLGPVAPRGM